MDLKKLIQYINSLWTNTVAPTWKNLSDHSTERIVRAIEGKENAEQIAINNPESITKPLIDAQNATTEAVKSIPRVELPSFDLRPLEAQIAALKNALEAKELSIGDTNIEVDTKSVVQAIEKLQKAIPSLKEHEIIDYTLIFDEMMKIMERPHYSSELAIVINTLQRIADRPSFQLPEDLITKDGLKVTGLIGRGGGRGAYDTVWQKNVAGTKINPATEETLQKSSDKIPTYDLYISYNGDGSVNQKIWKTAGTATVVKTLTYNYTGGVLTSKTIA